MHSHLFCRWRCNCVLSLFFFFCELQLCALDEINYGVYNGMVYEEIITKIILSNLKKYSFNVHYDLVISLYYIYLRC